MLDFVIFAVTFLAVLLIAIIWLYPSSKKVTTIPGLDPSTKEDGNLSDIERAGSLHEFLVETHEQYGPITGFWMGQRYVVSIASPELFKEHSNVFDRPAELYRFLEPVLGLRSLLFANGSDGRSRRRHYDPLFSPEHLHHYSGQLQKVAKSIEKSWETKGESDHIPVTEFTLKYAIKSALLTTMGEFFEDEKVLLSFRHSYEKVWSEMEHRLLDPMNPDDNDPRQKQFKEALKSLKSVLKQTVDHRKENNLHKHGDLLIDSIIKSNLDEETVIDECSTFLTWGFHTVANLLTWCFYFLATHKDVQSKLYKEIQKVLGEKGVVTHDNFGQLRYMMQVIDETLRCAVVAPWVARFQDFDSELGGHKIPKNTPVIQAVGAVLQDETLWPLPNRFDPDRFTAENTKDRPMFAFSPFGFAGKRKCPAHRFAYLESAVLVASLVRRFEVSMWSDQVVQPVYGILTHPAEEIWIKVTKRS